MGSLDAHEETLKRHNKSDMENSFEFKINMHAISEI